MIQTATLAFNDLICLVLKTNLQDQQLHGVLAPRRAGEELPGIMLAELPTLLPLTAAIGELDAW